MTGRELVRPHHPAAVEPGESQGLVVTYNSADLQGATPVVSVSGWNVAKVDVAAAVQ